MHTRLTAVFRDTLLSDQVELRQACMSAKKPTQKPKGWGKFGSLSNDRGVKPSRLLFSIFWSLYGKERRLTSQTAAGNRALKVLEE